MHIAQSRPPPKLKSSSLMAQPSGCVVSHACTSFRAFRLCLNLAFIAAQRSFIGVTAVFSHRRSFGTGVQTNKTQPVEPLRGQPVEPLSHIALSHQISSPCFFPCFIPCFSVVFEFGFHCSSTIFHRSYSGVFASSKILHSLATCAVLPSKSPTAKTLACTTALNLSITLVICSFPLARVLEALCFFARCTFLGKMFSPFVGKHYFDSYVHTM